METEGAPGTRRLAGLRKPSPVLPREVRALKLRSPPPPSCSAPAVALVAGRSLPSGPRKGEGQDVTPVPPAPSYEGRRGFIAALTSSVPQSERAARSGHKFLRGQVAEGSHVPGSLCLSEPCSPAPRVWDDDLRRPDSLALAKAPGGTRAGAGADAHGAPVVRALAVACPRHAVSQLPLGPAPHTPGLPARRSPPAPPASGRGAPAPHSPLTPDAEAEQTRRSPSVCSARALPPASPQGRSNQVLRHQPRLGLLWRRAKAGACPALVTKGPLPRLSGLGNRPPERAGPAARPLAPCFRRLTPPGRRRLS